MVSEYARLHGQKGYVNASYQLCQLANPTIDELRAYGFPAANFDVFTSICNALAPKDSPRIFHHPQDCTQRFEEYLRDSVAAGDGILAVVRNPDGNCHILPVIGYDGTNLTTYEPVTGTIETKDNKHYTLNRDCVLLRRK